MLLRLEGLGRCFQERWVFRSLSLEANRGDIVALSGANGSGKTTLLRVLATLLTPSEGDGAVNGHSLVGAPTQVRRRIGWVPASEGGFFPRLNGHENLRFHGYLNKLSRKEFEGQLEQFPKLATLTAALKTPYYLCSAGMRQSLHLARVAMTKPEVFLLDEPTRSLDATTREEIWNLLKSAAGNSVVLLASHSEKECETLGAKRFEWGPSV